MICLAECDNCAQTLLKDLEKLDEELQRIKSQLGNATASASAQERLKNLEKALLDTKVKCPGPASLSCNHELFKRRSKEKKKTTTVNQVFAKCAELCTPSPSWYSTLSQEDEGTARVCLFKHWRSLLISNLSEFSPNAHVST